MDPNTNPEIENGYRPSQPGDPMTSSPMGSNLAGVRQYNERLVLQLIRRAGGMPKADIARATHLSAQTVSVIINRLIKEGLLIKQPPQKGKVGQPSVPISLNPEGAYSVGIKIGRRSMDILLMGFTGQVLERISKRYTFPEPEDVFLKIERGLGHIRQSLSDAQRQRMVGIGVAAPFGIGGWEKEIGAPSEVLAKWREIDLEKILKSRIDPELLFSNDATAACVSELVFGQGTKFNSFLYMFIGTFIGGGVVINGSLFPGRFANAGAIGSMPVCLPDKADGRHPNQLISHASLWSLESRLEKAGYDSEHILQRTLLNDPSGIIIREWMNDAAKAMAHAIASSTSVIDFDGIIIDGSLPSDTIRELVDRTQKAFSGLDLEGLIIPQIVAGSIGANARALGGAILPLYSAFAPDREVLLKTEALK